jgi:hypothetical protein
MPDSIGSNGISAVCSGYSNISFMYADSSNLGYNTTAKDGSMKIMDSAGISTLLSSTAAVSGNYDNQSSVIFNTSSLRNTSFYESSINNVIIDLSSNTTLYNKSNTASLGNVNAVEMPSHPCFKSIVTTLKTSFHLIESIKYRIWFGCVNHATAWFTTVQYRLSLMQRR